MGDLLRVVSMMLVVLVGLAWVQSDAHAADRQRCDEAAIKSALDAIVVAPIGQRSQKAAAIIDRNCKKMDRRLGDRLAAKAGGEPIEWQKITGIDYHWPRVCKRHRKIDMYLATPRVEASHLKRTYATCGFGGSKVFTEAEFINHQSPAVVALALMTYRYLRDHGVSHKGARRAARMIASLEG
jgi:hypothetical protein